VGLFEGQFTFIGPVRDWDVTPDGRRFLMVQPREAPPRPPVEVVLVEHWFEELKRVEAGAFQRRHRRQGVESYRFK
jgi:hypothetical protein